MVALLTVPSLINGAGSNSEVLSLKQSGLESYNPQNSTNLQANIEFGGDATSRNASYTVFDDSMYLHIGVRAPANSSWAGYYQVTPSTYAELAHVVLVAPPTTLTSYFTNGLYIQASNQVQNYVTCVSVTNATGTYWMVIHGYKIGNNESNPTEYDNLWHDKSANQALTRDCVLVTNGQNFLQIYLDHALVYQNTLLSLGMNEPFNFFVGVESEYAHQLTYGSNRGFYVTNGDSVNVTGLPSKATIAEIVDNDGNVLAAGPVKSGTATIDLGGRSFPIAGYIEIFDNDHTMTNASTVARTQKEVSIFGGDVFSVGPNPSTTSQLTVDSQDTNGNALNGYYTVVMKDGVQTAADWLPTTFTLQRGQTYSVIVSDYGGYVFDHWSDGSLSRIRAFSISSNTEVSAIFRNANAPPPSGHALIKVSAVDSSGKPLIGFYSTLWRDGFIISQSYSPTSFVVSDDTSYLVTMSGYGSHVFIGWQRGSNDTGQMVVTGSGTVTNLVAVYR
ncbi:MAG: hypothetical protein OK455_02430 [Thaumarchaeota archaeon]|nr:hypothetical protein [Nitrososphaerota archaeon]